MRLTAPGRSHPDPIGKDLPVILTPPSTLRFASALTRQADAQAAADELIRAIREQLGSSRIDVAFLLQLFELEKAFYELRYELDNRPDWVHVPLGGLTALLLKSNRQHLH